MSCTRCGATELFQFEASKGAVAPEVLPLVCRGCGQISVGGVPVQFPPAMEQQAKDLAALADAAGKEAKEEVLADPDQRIELYFGNVYRRAYLDGFWRALLFWRHNGKEGRLRRVRELWAQQTPLTPSNEHTYVTMAFKKAAYDELRQLLELGDHHVTRPAHERPTPHARRPRVPGRTR